MTAAVFDADPSPHTIVNKPPPDFSALPFENAIKHSFDIKHGSWSQRRVQIKIAPEPFARGGLRKAYHMLDLDAAEDNEEVTYVAKMAIDPYEDREIYFQDVEMQMYAREWADKFNSYNPPKRVEFIQAWLIELVDRPGNPICGVERFIDGPYRKHNNNFGYVSDDERNTPQAFSHFTYEASGKVLLICDIQGVNDLYTDPQIHNREGIGFGKGNMGERGFERFLATHRCNHICRYLKLPSINAKIIDAGTKAPTTIMQYRKVDVVNVHMPPGQVVEPPLNGFHGTPRPPDSSKPTSGYVPYQGCHLERTSLVNPAVPSKGSECCCIIS
jgi:elongation factor 2 kinase